MPTRTTFRLLALVPRPLDTHANQRFRIEQWAPHLEREHGISITFAPFESPELAELLNAPGRRPQKLVLAIRDSVRRWHLRTDARGYDGAVVVHEASMLGGLWFEKDLVRHGIPFIYDFDDAIWMMKSEVSGDWTTRLWRSPSKVPDICRMASAITVGNEYLAQFARELNPNVAIVRTSIDVDEYKPAPPRRSAGPFTIAWSGSRSTLVYLESIRLAIEELGRQRPVTVRVISNASRVPDPYDHAMLDFTPWTAGVEPRALAESDVGIMPLPDTPTTRGKCGLKALQYMALARATVVSPVGINREIVRDGENGLWAESHHEWVSQLDRLAREPALRQRLADAGRRTVEDGYTAQHSARAFADVVRRVIPRATAR